jgi:hypothetical protein
MSIFSSISNAAHTFVNWFEKEITAVKKAAPSIEKSADAAFKYASAVVGIVATQVPSGSEAEKILDEILADIKVASAVVFDAGAHANVGGLIQTIVDNLGDLLKAGHITNAGSVATVTKVINTLAALVSAFLTIAPAA